MRNSRLRFIRRLTLGVALGLLLTMGGVRASGALASPSAQMTGGMDQLKGLTGRSFEIAFMSMMIPHHTAAVEMANLVLDRGQHPELKTAAQGIISSQNQEIAQMTSWLQTWYGTAPQANWGQMMQQDMAGMGMPADMQKLGTLQGDAFDKQFLLSMTTHHAMAVEMAQLVATRATHAELKSLAQGIIRSQSAEIAEFSGWLKAWYQTDMPSSNMSGSMNGNMGGMSGQPGATGTSGLPQTGHTTPAPVGLALVLAALLLLVGGGLRHALRRAR